MVLENINEKIELELNYNYNQIFAIGYLEYKFIVPLLAYDENFDKWYAFEKGEAGSRLVVWHSNFEEKTPLYEKFSQNELFAIKRIILTTNYNPDDPNSLSHCTYFNQLESLVNNDKIIDVFEGELNLTNQTFKPYITKYFDLFQENYIFDRLFLVKSGEYAYGPFRATRLLDGTYIELKNSRGIINRYKAPEYCYLEVTINSINRIIIKSLKSISEFIVESIDFKSKNELINWVKNELKEFKPDLFLEYKDLIEKLKRIDFNAKQKQDRYDRVIKLFSEGIESENIKRNFFYEIEKTASFQDVIEQLSKEKLALQNQIRDLESKTKDMVHNFTQQQEKRELLDNEIELLNSQMTQKIQEIEEQKVKVFNDEIKNKQEKIEQLDKKIADQADIIEKVEYYNKLDDIKNEVNQLEEDKRDLEFVNNGLKKDFIQNQKNAHKILNDLIKAKTQFDFLSGRELTPNNSREKEFSNITIDNFEGDLRDYFETVHQKLLKCGRKYPIHFIANILICIYQNMFTIFAGLPGTGKTTLARKITGIIAPKNRAVEIPVARGWTSQKDIIGFSNPLSKQFHPAATGLYDLLKQLDYEYENKHFLKSPLSFVILDEANLSPLEHYWATFYNLTDTVSTENNPLSIELGKNERLRFTNNLRFIGTMNYDQTTEDLSPRLIDRVNIIRLEPNTFENYNDSFNEVEPVCLNQETVIKMFGLDDFANLVINRELTQNLTDKEKEIFDKIEEQLKELGIFISPRVKKSIIDYCSIGRQVMNEDLKPLDYCIAQRVLTQINLQGDLSKKLDELNEIFENMNLKESQAKKVLTMIIQKAKLENYTHDNFNYFLID